MPCRCSTVGLPARRETAIAKAFCNRACQFVTLTAHQLHGGVGFMQEFDLQMYTRQMQGMALRLGTLDEHLEVVADELLGDPLAAIGVRSAAWR